MFLVIDKRTQACQSPLLVFGLVTCLSTFHQNLLILIGKGIMPHVSGTHARLHLVDILSSCSTTAESIPLDGSLVDFHIELLGLGQDSHCGGTGVHTSLCLCGGHPLYTMDTRLILEYSVHALSCDAEDNLLVATDSSFAEAAHAHLPSLEFDVTAIHTEEVSGKEGCLIASRTSAYLHDDILAVLGIGRYEQEFDFLLELRYACLAVVEFLTQHILGLSIILHGHHLLGILDILQQTQIFLAGLHYASQVLVFLGEFHVTLLVGYHRRVGNECGHFLVS